MGLLRSKGPRLGDLVDSEEDGEEEEKSEHGQGDEGTGEEEKGGRPAQAAGSLLVVLAELHVRLLHEVDGGQAAEEDEVQAAAAPDAAVDAVVDAVVRVGQDAGGGGGGESRLCCSLAREQVGVELVKPSLASDIHEHVIAPGIHRRHDGSPFPADRLGGGEVLPSAVGAGLAGQPPGLARRRGFRCVAETLSGTCSIARQDVRHRRRPARRQVARRREVPGASRIPVAGQSLQGVSAPFGTAVSKAGVGTLWGQLAEEKRVSEQVHIFRQRVKPRVCLCCRRVVVVVTVAAGGAEAVVVGCVAREVGVGHVAVV